jgi:Arm DNA-binding domain
VTDRDGMYVHVTAKGAMSFRMDYRLNGRRETIYLGKYGPEGLSLARASEKCIDARRNIAARYSHCPKDLCRKLAVLLPSRYDADAPMSRVTFNRVFDCRAGQARRSAA